MSEENLEKRIRTYFLNKGHDAPLSRDEVVAVFKRAIKDDVKTQTLEQLQDSVEILREENLVLRQTARQIIDTTALREEFAKILAKREREFEEAQTEIRILQTKLTGSSDKLRESNAKFNIPDRNY